MLVFWLINIGCKYSKQQPTAFLFIFQFPYSKQWYKHSTPGSSKLWIQNSWLIHWIPTTRVKIINSIFRFWKCCLTMACILHNTASLHPLYSMFYSITLWAEHWRYICVFIQILCIQAQSKVWDFFIWGSIWRFKIYLMSLLSSVRLKVKNDIW